ncbi:MAG: hypothetical protein CMP23_04455 [Rickettsiales bacterium]|nr:hypothetical protein [Rickettsiales bacterium]|tara:strand:+ start:213 stop:881 length:669 start_codon:yes stop_codon:yes gene_type:complete
MTDIVQVRADRWLDSIELAHSSNLRSRFELDYSPAQDPSQGLKFVVETQHFFNCALWAEEDRARSKVLGDAHLAQVKRQIDSLNQRRNDWIEVIDRYFAEQLEELRPPIREGVRLNSETVGSIVDRLSILTLRRFALEQLIQQPISRQAVPESRARLELCVQQHQMLTTCLRELLLDLLQGARVHYSFRTMKLYNDERFNPHVGTGTEAQVGQPLVSTRTNP